MDCCEARVRCGVLNLPSGLNEHPPGVPTNGITYIGECMMSGCEPILFITSGEDVAIEGGDRESRGTPKTVSAEKSWKCVR